MKLTIEVDNPSEIVALLAIFKTMNLEGVQVIVDKAIEDKTDRDVLRNITRPTSKKLELEALKKAKNYKGVNREQFNQLIKEINIVEPIDVLLSQLSQ
ncbi:MAG: hypothetical protein U0Y10_08670 [Spirosomataceae bacterium]